MVYLVRKKIKGHDYLYLHKTVGKTTEYVKYLGRPDKYTESDLKRIIYETEEGVANEDKRLTRQARQRSDRC